MNGLRSHIKNSKECLIRYPNTSKSVKTTRLRLVSSTHFSGFGYPDETLFLVFDILHEFSPSQHLNELDFTCNNCKTFENSGLSYFSGWANKSPYKKNQAMKSIMHT